MPPTIQIQHIISKNKNRCSYRINEACTFRISASKQPSYRNIRAASARGMRPCRRRSVRAQASPTPRDANSSLITTRKQPNMPHNTDQRTIIGWETPLISLFRQSLTLIGLDEDKISVHIGVLTRPAVLCTWCIVKDHSAYFRGRCTVSEAHPVNCVVLCACTGRALNGARALIQKWHQVNTSRVRKRTICVAPSSVTTYSGVLLSTHVD